MRNVGASAVRLLATPLDFEDSSTDRRAGQWRKRTARLLRHCCGRCRGERVLKCGDSVSSARTRCAFKLCCCWSLRRVKRLSQSSHVRAGRPLATAQLLYCYCNNIIAASMECLLAERSLRWHTPFRTQSKLQHRPACSLRKTCCEAVHRRHVALQLAAQDLSFETSSSDNSFFTAHDLQSRTAVNRRSLALAAATLGLLPSFRALAGECSSFAR